MKMEIILGCGNNSMIYAAHTGLWMQWIAHCMCSLVQVLIIIIIVATGLTNYFREYLKTSGLDHLYIENWEKEKRKKQGMIIFSMIENKTRLDFCMLLVYAQHPDLAHLSVYPKCAEGHTWTGRRKGTTKRYSHTAGGLISHKRKGLLSLQSLLPSLKLTHLTPECILKVRF